MFSSDDLQIPAAKEATRKHFHNLTGWPPAKLLNEGAVVETQTECEIQERLRKSFSSRQKTRKQLTCCNFIFSQAKIAGSHVEMFLGIAPGVVLEMPAAASMPRTILMNAEA